MNEDVYEIQLVVNHWPQYGLQYVLNHWPRCGLQYVLNHWPRPVLCSNSGAMDCCYTPSIRISLLNSVKIS
jgi:hypothetical protein